VRQLAAAFDCQFIANLAEMSSFQRRKQAFSFEYTRNIRQTIQGGSKLPHSMAPFGRIFKNSYTALSETPALPVKNIFPR
jgi:hypothetical protein